MKAFLTAEIRGVKYDLGLPIQDVEQLTEEQIEETANMLGQAYGKLLLMAKKGELQ